VACRTFGEIIAVWDEPPSKAMIRDVMGELIGRASSEKLANKMHDNLDGTLNSIQTEDFELSCKEVGTGSGI
jgi:hypothetical protein